MLGSGELETVDVFARERWNVTGLFLEKDVAYRFEASGQWLDGDDPYDPAGAPGGRFNVREAVHVASTVLGKAELIYKWITNNPKADFWATRRYEQFNWLALIGVVANGAIDNGPKKLPDHEFLLIGNATDFAPKELGYLYCFANDAWHAYGNNKGSVSLTVTRLQESSA